VRRLPGPASRLPIVVARQVGNNHILNRQSPPALPGVGSSLRTDVPTPGGAR